MVLEFRLATRLRLIPAADLFVKQLAYSADRCGGPPQAFDIR